MSEDIDAKIAGFDGSYNGLEAKSLFIEGILKRHSKYYCYICGVNLIQNNVEKYLDEHIKRKPYFRCKDTDPHLTYCRHFTLKNNTSDKSIKKHTDSNDGCPRILDIPKINFDTLEIVEDIVSTKETNRSDSIADKTNEINLKKRNVTSSSSKIIHFVDRFDDICFQERDKQIRLNILKNEPMAIGVKRGDFKDNFYNNFRNIRTVTMEYCDDLSDYPRIYWHYLNGDHIEFENRYECNISSENDPEKKVLILYKKHLIDGISIPKKNAFVLTIPKFNDGRLIFQSIDKKLAVIYPYRSYKLN